VRTGGPHCATRASADAPTVWSAEGLLLYPPGDAEERLFQRITELSAAGSRLAADYIPDIGVVAAHEHIHRRQWDRMRVDLKSLVRAECRRQLTDVLAAHGWHAEGRQVTQLYADHGLTYPTSPRYATWTDVTFVEARKTP
jgi:O-methyltransferase involved in polyketide biosynthesis